MSSNRFIRLCHFLYFRVHNNPTLFYRLGIVLIIVGSPITIVPQSAWADGFRNPFQSASATAQGAAFLAQADDPSAIHYNPAGMTQLPGVQHSFGVAFVSPKTTFRNSDGEKVDHTQIMVLAIQQSHVYRKCILRFSS